MKLEELVKGKIYKCRLSGKTMLVVKTKKPVKDEEDVEVTAGKFVIEQNGIQSFMYDEISDGQLEEIKAVEAVKAGKVVKLSVAK